MTTLDDAVRKLAATPRLLVALDFDGVLAPIVPVPSQARPLPAAVAAIAALAALPDTTVALLSGRGLADLAAVSGFGPPVRMIGSHGGEFADPGGAGSMLDDAARDRLDRLTAELRELVAGAPGVSLESKPAGVAVHVRNAERTVATRVLDAVRAGPATRPGVESTPGKEVLDLAVLEVSKGIALDRLREQIGAGAVFFAGDDVTDETAFIRLRPDDVGVKVGDGDTAAQHRVADPPGVAALLERLLTARS
jgi:trehalose 6-phosphate phosphatase